MMKKIIFVMYRFFLGNWPTTRSKFYETIHVYVVQNINLFFIAIMIHNHTNVRYTALVVMYAQNVGDRLYCKVSSIPPVAYHLII